MTTTVPTGARERRHNRPVSWAVVICGSVLAGLALLLVLDRQNTDYVYLAAYSVLQFVALASAWNILGGYAGYVNFGVGGFFAVGVYTSVIINKTVHWPLIAVIPLAAGAAGLLGLAVGYLTLRLQGVFFSIATLALSVVLNTIVVNWSFVGGSRGVYVLRPETGDIFGSYARYLFVVMLVLAIATVLIARFVELSSLGRGLTALRGDEIAAQCSGVPALRLKLLATAISGALLGAAASPFPTFVTYVDPTSAFSFSITVNTIAMALIGGRVSWIGPVIGAVLLGVLQQVATVTISSALNLLIVGIMLVVFVTVAPNGIVGLVRSMRERRR